VMQIVGMLVVLVCPHHFEVYLSFSTLPFEHMLDIFEHILEHTILEVTLDNA